MLQLTQRITQAENDYSECTDDIGLNTTKIHDNAQEAINNKGKIDTLFMDVSDVQDCLNRQWDEQKTLRAVLELYCHQFTYVAHLPH